ncbi:hypothetical protein [Streptomyces noursei]|uniref:hypothetical protein n=1 Tax=Streptomyces noursei TaxID=1971 RepID=UPI0013520C53
MGDCDFHAIVCSDLDGIALPSPQRDVPLEMDKPRERWCDACRAIAATTASS